MKLMKKSKDKKLEVKSNAFWVIWFSCKSSNSCLF